MSGLPGSQPTYCSVVRHVVYYPARSDPAAAKEQHRDLHPGRNTDRRDRVDGGRDGRARGSRHGQGDNGGCGGRGPHPCRRRVAQRAPSHNEDRQSSVADAPAGESAPPVLLTAVTAVVTAVQVESVNVEPQAVAFGLRTPTSRSNRSQRRCYPAWHGIGSRFGDTPSPGANRSRGHNARGRTNVMKHHT